MEEDGTQILAQAALDPISRPESTSTSASNLPHGLPGISALAAANAATDATAQLRYGYLQTKQPIHKHSNKCANSTFAQSPAKRNLQYIQHHSPKQYQPGLFMCTSTDPCLQSFRRSIARYVSYCLSCRYEWGIWKYYGEFGSCFFITILSLPSRRILHCMSPLQSYLENRGPQPVPVFSQP